MRPLHEPRGASAWAGRLVSAFVVLILIVDGGVDLFAPALVRPDMLATGFPTSLATMLGIVTLFCALLYAVPQTSVLGAILVTGFVGGAICTHFRLGEIGSPPQLVSTTLGVLAWAGLYLRLPGLRTVLLPFDGKAGAAR